MSRPAFILATVAALLCGARPRLHALKTASAAFHGAEPKRHSDNGSNRPLLVCFGDSLTAGAGVDPDEAYPAYLQQRLDQAGYAYHVVNAGVSGNTTKDGLSRLDAVLQQHPQVVVVEFGGNDGLRGLSTQQAQRNLDIMVGKLKASGAKVALAGITLPPQYGGDYIRSFNAMFPAVANKYHVPLLPFVLQDVYGVPGDIQDDGVHATAQGNKQVAANVEKLVLPLLKR
ncbi:MAG TPA: arylesterase [Acidobacteriaceae bacterium]|nr:arylesterase [Acidobacteriaceae bacterium]